MGATGIRQERRLVRVWFGEHVICNQLVDPALANRFEQAMRRRFPTLKVTNDPWPSVPTSVTDTPPAQQPASSSPASSTWQSGPR